MEDGYLLAQIKGNTPDASDAVRLSLGKDAVGDGKMFGIAVRMKDGTLLDEAAWGGFHESWSAEEPKKWGTVITFASPIDPEQVTALVINGEDIPLF